MAWQTTSETQSKRALSILLYGEKLRTFLDILNSVSYALANIQLQHKLCSALYLLAHNYNAVTFLTKWHGRNATMYVFTYDGKV